MRPSKVSRKMVSNTGHSQPRGLEADAGWSKPKSIAYSRISTLHAHCDLDGVGAVRACGGHNRLALAPYPELADLSSGPHRRGIACLRRRMVRSKALSRRTGAG